MKAHGENVQEQRGDAEKIALNYVYVLELPATMDFRILDVLKILTVLLSLRGLRTWPILTFGS